MAAVTRRRRMTAIPTNARRLRRILLQASVSRVACSPTSYVLSSWSGWITGAAWATLVANPWVQDGVDDVHGKVGKPDQSRVEGEDADHDVVVTAEDAGDELLAQPGYAKNVFNHHRAGDDASCERTQDGHHRYERVAQGVTHDDDARLESLGPGGPHIVGA